MLIKQVKSSFEALNPQSLVETDYQTKGYHLDVKVSVDQVVAAAELMDNLGFFLESITGVDWLGQVVGFAKPVKKESPAAEGEEPVEGEAAAAGGADEEESVEPGEKMEVVYDYNHTGFDLCRVVVRCLVSRDNPELPTISEVSPGANWHERETHDFFGIRFTGHPDLSPLLLPEDADFHPLLKDFKA